MNSIIHLDVFSGYISTFYVYFVTYLRNWISWYDKSSYCFWLDYTCRSFFGLTRIRVACLFFVRIIGIGIIGIQFIFVHLIFRNMWFVNLPWLRVCFSYVTTVHTVGVILGVDSNNRSLAGIHLIEENFNNWIRWISSSPFASWIVLIVRVYRSRTGAMMAFELKRGK